MDDWIRAALDADVTATAAAVQVAAVVEAGRQADALLRGTGPGEWPVPGSIEWHAEEGTATPVRRERAWQLLQLRIGLGAGLDPLPTRPEPVDQGQMVACGPSGATFFP